MLYLVNLLLERVEQARFRALAQILVDKDKGVEAFDQYMAVAYPYLETEKKRTRLSHIDQLKKEIARGPIRVVPLQGPTMKSRVSTAKARVKIRSREEERKLYQKLGRNL